MAEPSAVDEAASAPAAATVEARVNVVLDDVHVTYRVYEDRRPSLREFFAGGKRRTYRAIKAVQGVSLVARSGESIGIVGRNGSGKSTLLQALAGLLPVDHGQVFARSQPTLLGVGSALQPGLSGRRNVTLGCLALGMPAAEVERLMPEIVDFAGLEDFIDLPLATYSSGMRARLLFAIATSVVPEILVIDEALGVGDEIFKRKSQERMRALREQAGTVFLVSHALDTVVESCNRALWLEAGKVVQDGQPPAVVRAYQKFMRSER